jgi:hypothetical protein
MYSVLAQKFAQHDDLVLELLSTGNGNLVFVSCKIHLSPRLEGENFMHSSRTRMTPSGVLVPTAMEETS